MRILYLSKNVNGYKSATTNKTNTITARTIIIMFFLLISIILNYIIYIENNIVFFSLLYIYI